MKSESINNKIDNNGLGNLHITNLTPEELEKVKVLEDEINKNYHGDRIALMALDINNRID